MSVSKRKLEASADPAEPPKRVYTGPTGTKRWRARCSGEGPLDAIAFNHERVQPPPPPYTKTQPPVRVWASVRVVDSDTEAPTTTTRRRSGTRTHDQERRGGGGEWASRSGKNPQRGGGTARLLRELDVQPTTTTQKRRRRPRPRPATPRRPSVTVSKYPPRPHKTQRLPTAAAPTPTRVGGYACGRVAVVCSTLGCVLWGLSGVAAVTLAIVTKCCLHGFPRALGETLTAYCPQV